MKEENWFINWKKLVFIVRRRGIVISKKEKTTVYNLTVSHVFGLFSG